MPLTLILGPANSAKAGEVLGAFADAAPRGALLVVPTRGDAEHYSRELAGQGCVLRSVLTFGGLVAEIARRAGYASRRLSAFQRERLVRRTVAGSSFGPLAAVSETPGFLAAAVRLITELERSMVTAPRFAAALERWAGGDDGRRAWARDTASIYLGYADQLERLGAVDAELFTWRALDALRLAPAVWGDAAVFFYGFDDLHGLERDAIETLARIVGTEVTVSLNFEAGRPALSARAEMVAELRQQAARVREAAARDDYYDPAARSSLYHLERSLFEPDAARIDPGDAVRLLESGGELAEAELLAAEVRGMLDAGIAAREIAVLHRRLDPAARLALTRTFARYGIPLTVSQSMPLGHSALGRSLTALARCAFASGPGTARDVLDYLRTPGLLRRPDVADRLEVKIRSQPLRTVEEARQAVALDVREIDVLAQAAEPLAELVRQGRRLLALRFKGQARVLTDEEHPEAEALSSLVRCQEELWALGEAPTGRELVELLEALEIGPRPGLEPDGVLITDPLSIRARRFSCVLVAGLQQGVFPRPAAPDPFLPDERRRELAAASGLRLRLSDDALDRERYLFYAAVSRATRRVVLSYRSSDEEGNLDLASPFIEDVAEVLAPGWMECRRRRLLSDVTWTPADAPTARERERAQAVLEPERAATAVGPSRRLGPAALAHVRHTEVLSAGALERYAECHMKWLVERELAPRPLEPQPEPLARGSWVHDVLETVLSRLDGAITPESLPEALRLLDQTMAEVSPSLAAGRSPALRRALAQTIAADLRRYFEQEASMGAGWPPQGLELRFGFQDDEPSLPALVVERDGELIAVRGAIDRVDVEPGGRRAIVRDYKTGQVRSEHQGSRWSSAQRLQVALYMVAVRQLLGLEPVAGLYQPLVGKDLRPRGLYREDAPVGEGLLPGDARDSTTLVAELDDACRRAVSLAVALRAGDLEPCPETCSRGGCRYPGICRAG